MPDPSKRQRGHAGGRRKRPGEDAKRADRKARRRDAWNHTSDGAGARSIDEPDRHRRQPRRGRS
jgi:hypothetical protein